MNKKYLNHKKHTMKQAKKFPMKQAKKFPMKQAKKFPIQPENKKQPIGKRNLNHGWNPDMPDIRDYKFVAKKITLPSSVDLRNSGFMPTTVYDQDQLGSCTANAIAGAIEYEMKKQREVTFTPSRLFIYYNERVMEGTVRQDSGAQIRDGVKCVVKQGVCPEKDWQYIENRFAVKPPNSCYATGLNHQVLTYERVGQTLTELKSCLAMGYPIIFGFSVYDSFESDTVARTGILNMPKKGEQLLGGHAVLCIGYNESTQRFLVRNSWGSGWGLGGYYWMPYAYLTNNNLCDDFWKITLLE